MREGEREGERRGGGVLISREDLAIDGSLLVAVGGHVERLTRSIVAYAAARAEETLSAYRDSVMCLN